VLITLSATSIDASFALAPKNLQAGY